MTYREKLKIEHPDMITMESDGGCKGCPEHYGYCSPMSPEECEHISCQECWDREIPGTNKPTITNGKLFDFVEVTDDWMVVYHRETKVMYAVSVGSHNRGRFTVLVNPDGTPLLYKGE